MVCCVIAPSQTFGQVTETQNAITEAKQDANKSVGKLSWLTLGALAGTISVVGCIAGFNLGTRLNTEHPNDITATEIIGTGIGCLSGGLLILYTSNRNTTPPAENFIGKSPEYVSAYTEAYKKEIRSTRLNYSTIGYVATAVPLSLYVITTVANVALSAD